MNELSEKNFGVRKKMFKNFKVFILFNLFTPVVPVGTTSFLTFYNS